MRSMGVETVIVVDVEGKDDMCECVALLRGARVLRWCFARGL